MFFLFRRKQFKKDIKKLIRNPKFDSDKLAVVLSQLMSGEKLAEKYPSHTLGGDFNGCYECHIQPDVLLIYTIDKRESIVYLVRIGSHSDLF